MTRLFGPHWWIHFAFLSSIGFLIVFALNPSVFLYELSPGAASIQSFKTMLIGIVLEAIPFLLLGVLVSSLLQEFVSEEWIRRIVPRNPLAGIAFACLLGIVFPVCECGLIPIVRRLIAKGMPAYIGAVFILVGPIVNPVVFAATYMAFRNRPEMVYGRMGLALFVGFVIGYLLYCTIKTNPLKRGESSDSGHHHHHHHQGGNRLYAALEHAGGEFMDMGKYLIFGSVIAAAIQTFVPRGSLVDIGEGQISSHLFMMGLAYILSLCSTSDAFVASSFAGTFTAGSLLSFLVLGPMLDFKGTLMLLSAFRVRFVLLLVAAVPAVVFVGAAAAEWIL